MPSTYTSLPPFLRLVRWLAAAQYLFSTLGIIIYLAFSFTTLRQEYRMASVTLQVWAPQQGQLHKPGYDSLVASKQPNAHRLVPLTERIRLKYIESNWGKKVVLELLGVLNSSADGRGSLPLMMYSMLTGMLLYRILNEMQIESPFTEKNARRIRWLGLLMISIDLYQYLARIILARLVPPVPLPGHSGTVAPYVLLDVGPEIGAWKFGLVLLVVAAVYQRGVVMAQEAELTV
ncbi:DUF2975 domain-containing protein [Hymenobacter cellulosilyticus]|uniref:DUF2975 domain-containing protein n=1 Tax=Hymenobacter cellulosilyticus TaxID=2932248 RepID=A0A8T9Q6J5_9BACT|nr:DUF2975 domain-containing protein [Hymenobacter cellulosilyticus]UOQ72582.1 DUF2975 domain-containing protein [Hymenobacter cellulosilyticus]